MMSTPYQTMTFGIMAFLTNDEITADILSAEEIADLLKKIPRFDMVEPELVKFYKDLVEKSTNNQKYTSPGGHWLWRWCFPRKPPAAFSKEYQAMHYGIIAFVSNKELTTGIIKTGQITALLKKIPMYEEPDVQAKFYKKLVLEYNARKNTKIQMVKKTSSKNSRWWFSHPARPPVEEYTFNTTNIHNVNVFVTDQNRVSEFSVSTRGSYEST